MLGNALNPVSLSLCVVFLSNDLCSGDMRNAVAVPNGEDPNEWLAVHSEWLDTAAAIRHLADLRANMLTNDFLHSLAG